MTAAVTLDGLPPEVIAAGRLIDLLTGSGATDVGIDPTWFDEPVKRLEGIPGRLGELTTLLAAVLGEPEPDPPDIPGGSGQWYHLPNLDLGVPTAAHVIAPAAGATSGALGVGLFAANQLGPATIEAHVYVPVADLQGRFLLAGGDAQPIHVGLSAKSTGRFSVTGGASFAALEIDAQIHLDGNPPTCTVSFVDLQDAGGKPSTYTSLKDLADETVLGWFGAVIAQGATPWLLMYPGDAPGRVQPPPDAPDQTMEWPMTIGDILAAANFLTKHEPASSDDTTPIYQINLQNLQGTGKQIAENLAFAVLDALAAADDPLIALPGGGVYVEHRAETNQYGVRGAAQIALGEQVDLCLGEWMTGEADDDNWMTRSSPKTPAERGLSILLLSHVTGQNPMFDPGFSLTSVGLNVRGGAGAPLVDIEGYTLGEAEVRVSVSLASDGWQWGVGARLDDVGFPLGPGFTQAQAAGGNVVARTLVAGDDGSAPGGAGGQPAAVNPTFSAEVAYTSTGEPLLELLDPSGTRTDLIWFPIQRRFGPLNCQKVGLVVKLTGQDKDDPVLGVVFDGGVELGPLDVELDELSVDAHLKEIGKGGYDVDLEGLTISFASGGVAISGGLIKSAANGSPSYDGEALIKAEDLAIGAIASFGSLPGGGTSLFVFAWLDAAIGGPPCFFITGLSAGFGFNRSLKIPAQGDVQSFPLVAGLADQSRIGGTRPAGGKAGAPQPPPSPAAALATLKDWLPVERGEFWLAAGLQFTTFEIIKSNALLIVEFGHDLVVAVLGIATLKQPAEGETFVYAELDMDVVFRPEQGSLQAAAVLAPSSYVMTPEAHLTGGFALSAWWGRNEHAGDFVFTIGGYHPAFDVPAWYPREPRVGIDWPVSSEITIVGGAYFAITPAAMMGGAALAATFDAGPLRAWLTFDADVLIRWKPFYLVADASISVGVSYHLHHAFVDVTLSVEIGADFWLWGPPMGFKAHVDWYVVSFTISGGADQAGAAAMDWTDFKGLFPSKTQVTDGPERSALKAVANAMPTAPPAQTTPVYVHIDATAGLLRSTVIDGLGHWLVRPGQLVLSVHSAIPASDIVVTGSAGHPDQAVGQTTKVGMRGLKTPAGEGVQPADYQSLQTITVLAFPPGRQADIKANMATGSPCTTQPTGSVPVAATAWTAVATVQQVPKAMWGDPLPADSSPPINEPGGQTVPAQVGATLTPLAPPIVNCTPQMDIETVFADRTVETAPMAIAQDAVPAYKLPVPTDSFADIVHATAGPGAQRGALFAALQSLGVDPATDGDLSAMATTPGRDFVDEPMEVAPA